MEVYESPDPPPILTDGRPPEPQSAEVDRAALDTADARRRFDRSTILSTELLQSDPRRPSLAAARASSGANFARARPTGYSLRNTNEGRKERIARLRREVAELLADSGDDAGGGAAVDADQDVESVGASTAAGGTMERGVYESDLAAEKTRAKTERARETRQLSRLEEQLALLDQRQAQQARAPQSRQVEQQQTTEGATTTDDGDTIDTAEQTQLAAALAKLRATTTDAEGVRRISLLEDRLAGVEKRLSPLIDRGIVPAQQPASSSVQEAMLAASIETLLHRGQRLLAEQGALDAQLASVEKLRERLLQKVPVPGQLLAAIAQANRVLDSARRDTALRPTRIAADIDVPASTTMLELLLVIQRHQQALDDASLKPLVEITIDRLHALAEWHDLAATTNDRLVVAEEELRASKRDRQAWQETNKELATKIDAAGETATQNVTALEDVLDRIRQAQAQD